MFTWVGVVNGISPAVDFWGAAMNCVCLSEQCNATILAAHDIWLGKLAGIQVWLCKLRSQAAQQLTVDCLGTH
jgi:hypothetical protein